jgi:hypothetical protein
MRFVVQIGPSTHCRLLFFLSGIDLKAYSCSPEIFGVPEEGN